MKKGTGNFRAVEEMILVCDECGKELNSHRCIVYDYTWSDGYDNFGDVEEFCSSECLFKHLKVDVDSEHFYFPTGEPVSIIAPAEIIKFIIYGEK